MKIEINLQNVYHFENNRHSYKENGEFNYYQVEYEYRLIDNDINIRLGVLAFQNGQFNLNYEAEADLWSLYEDASEGIIVTIYAKIETSEKDNIEKYVELHAEDILDEINENTTKLKAYINNDLNKLKKLLTLLSHKFIAKRPKYIFAEKNITETIF